MLMALGAWSCGAAQGADVTEPDPDPSYLRACTPDDWTCETWGCEHSGIEGCYVECSTYSGVEFSAECPEPERPYCARVPDAGGGDWTCNWVTSLCMAEPKNGCSSL
jgi:hypothetical protein